MNSEEKMIERMMSIDLVLILGDKLHEDEAIYFNEHLDEMKQLMRDQYHHWKEIEKISMKKY